jgi:hypothetical protein
MTMPQGFLTYEEMSKCVGEAAEKAALANGMTKLEFFERLANEWNKAIQKDIDEGH